MNKQQIQKFLQVATEAAEEAGKVLETYWGKSFKIQEKTIACDLVTEVDHEAEICILKVLKSHFPEHDILAEESGMNKSANHDFLWAIDPLDGTTNYAHQFPTVAVSVALIYQGKPIVGVVLNPIHRELFQAAKGLGATLNQHPIKVSETPALAKSLLATGFAYDRCKSDDTNYPEFCHLTHITQGVRRAGAASLDLASVACGRFDGYWERGLKVWDMAAGIVLVEEAGGTVSAYDGTPVKMDSGRVLATNGFVHNSLSRELLAVKLQTS
jgi:myo-inositol-1(or 4)-monophosphatase